MLTTTRRLWWIRGSQTAAFVLCLCSCLKGVGDQEGPRIEAVQPTHDFGAVVEGSVVQHSFLIRNNGDAPLVIERVRTTCGCTAAAPKNKEIPPGTTDTIDVSFNTRGRKGRSSKTITVMSNDPKRPRIDLQIHADIERLLAFDPSFVELVLSEGEQKSVESWLTGKVAQEGQLAVTHIQGSDKLQAEVVTRRVGDQLQRGLRVTAKGDSMGRARGSIKVATGIERIPELILPFRLRVWQQGGAPQRDWPGQKP